MQIYIYSLDKYIISGEQFLPVADDDDNNIVTLNALLLVPPNKLSVTDMTPDDSNPLNSA